MRTLVWAVLALGVATGCSSNKSYMKNTRVSNTPENREIIRVCEEYRRTVERRSVRQRLQSA